MMDKETCLNIRLAEMNDQQALILLIAEFRQTLAQLRNKEDKPDLESAQKELTEYQRKEFPIYVAETDQGRISGYLVCRVDQNVVWAESLYVLQAYRRQGIGSELYAEAENLAAELGNDTLYNWVDPSNDRIISFLKKRGYNVLNLIELRRPGAGERMTRVIQVGENEFDHY
jgi:ribosomal protein S18 acetylase RimI-like enzyme